MIPDTRCRDAVTAACPRLFDDLEAILEVALGRAREALGDDTPCGRDLSGYVTLNPLTADNGNAVVVLLERMSDVAAETRGVQIRRTKVEAIVVAVLNGYPTVEMEGNTPHFPLPAELHEAARFVYSLMWCVYCEIVERIAAGQLLAEQALPNGLDALVTEAQASDYDGGQAGFQIKLRWFYD